MMKLRSQFYILLLCLFLSLPAQNSFARTILGISYSKQPVSVNGDSMTFSSQIEEAAGNLIKVHNYNDNKTLLSMLTKFNKLDAALLARETFEQQDKQQLIALGEVQLSAGADSTTLILAARSDLNETQQNQLVEGYQELLMSTEGLELLERYAAKPSSSFKQVAAIKPVAIELPVKAEPKATVPAAVVEPEPKQAAVPPAEPQPVKVAAIEQDIPVEIMPEEKVISAEQPKPAPKPVVKIAAAPRQPTVVQAAKPQPVPVTTPIKTVAVTPVSKTAPVPVAPPKPAPQPVVVKNNPEPVKLAQAVTKPEIKQPTPAMQPQPGPLPKRASVSSLKKQSWMPHVDVTSKLGNERSLAEATLFFPYSQTLNSMLFMDLRFQLDDNQTTEGNFGLGYREFISENWIFGAYGFVDLRRSENDNLFGQVTLGAEALAENYDARLNVYLADDKEYLIAKQDSLDQIVYFENNLVHQTGGVAFETREKAMSGVDAELGWRFPWFNELEVRGYLGGYYFTASDVEDISGPRGRLEIRFNDLFNWPGSLFELGGEVTHDDVRDTDYFVSARARFPFNYGKQILSPAKSGLSGRMTERIQRDPDIVIARQHDDASTAVSNEVLTSGSTPITFTHIDSNAATAAGTFEAPCSSLACISDGNDVVLVYADSEFTLTESMPLADGQRLLGETGTHSVQTDQFVEPILLPRVSAGINQPVLRDYSGTAIELADGSEVSGLDIENVGTAIYGIDVGGFSINNVNISGADYGIFLDGLSAYAPSVISDNQLEDIAFDGIYLYANDLSSVTATISGNTLQNIGTDLLGGIGIFLENEGDDFTAHIADNSVTGSSLEGIYLDNLTGGNQFTAVLSNNLVSDGLYDGISIVNGAAAGTMSVYLTNNRSSGDVDNSWSDYFLNNLGTLFELGATDPSATSDPGEVLANENNTRADGSTDITVDIGAVSDTITIVDKDGIAVP